MPNAHDRLRSGRPWRIEEIDDRDMKRWVECEAQFRVVEDGQRSKILLLQGFHNDLGTAHPLKEAKWKNAGKGHPPHKGNKLPEDDMFTFTVQLRDGQSLEFWLLLTFDRPKDIATIGFPRRASAADAQDADLTHGGAHGVDT